MEPNARVDIVGIGDDGIEGLTEVARRIVEQADVVAGPASLLGLLASRSAERLAVGSNLDELSSIIQRATSAGQRLVLLTGGDPLFYGVARFLCDRFGKDRINVVPHVSSMQLAFARVKESWDEAYLANLDTVPLPRAIERIRSAEKAGLFTSESVTPSVLATRLLAQNIDCFVAYVCENLGSPDERVTRLTLDELRLTEFAPLNVVILVRQQNVPDQPTVMPGVRRFGNPDEYFLQTQPKRGLLTPMEVRVIALALLDVGARDIVWDVGAGSGSVAIEAAQLAVLGEVMAIEMDAADHGMIVSNAERFGVRNVVPVLGSAPDVWRDLPDPDAIFVGGTGRSVAQIVKEAVRRLKEGGRIVVNVSSLENVAAVREVLRVAGWGPNVRMIQVAESVEQFESARLESRNPSFLISAVAPPRSLSSTMH
jgi:precorrin-6B C5,15-methyltransferase / cobalt-precorrin-6B C5,C15-methyltransferase